jgi:hypothetical protein
VAGMQRFQALKHIIIIIIIITILQIVYLHQETQTLYVKCINVFVCESIKSEIRTQINKSNQDYYVPIS